MARVSIATRQKVVSLRQQGLSQSEISRQTGVSRCAVQALLKKHKETGKVEDQKRSGRPWKLSGADERHIQLIRLQNRKMSSAAITSELAVTYGILVDPSTVRRSLARSGLSVRRSDKKQVLQTEQGKDSQAVCSADKPENLADVKCEQELWTDGSEIEICGSDGDAGESHKDGKQEA